MNDLAATDQTPALARRGPSTTSALANPNHRPSQAVARTKGRGLLLTTHFSGADKGRLVLVHTLLSAVGRAGLGCEALVKVGPLQLKPSVGQTGEIVSRERGRAASMARDLRRGTLSFDEFASQCGSSPDERIAELFDLLEHEPQRGGLFGVSEEAFADYQLRIDRAICALEE